MIRLLKIGFDSLLFTLTQMLVWIMLGFAVNPHISVVYSITYSAQFFSQTLVDIFASGANIRATKANDQQISKRSFTLGIIVILLLFGSFALNTKSFVHIMDISYTEYGLFCTYAILLLCLQTIIKLVCSQLYYAKKNSKANKITLVYNLSNLALVVVLCFSLKDKAHAVAITLCVDSIIAILIVIRNAQMSLGIVNVVENIKIASNGVLGDLGMLISFFVGYKLAFSFGTTYMVVITFVTLITDAQWDASYAINAAAEIDSSLNNVNYSSSLKNAYKFTTVLVLSSLAGCAVLYNIYHPTLWVLILMLGGEIFGFYLAPLYTIKEAYCQINHSRRITSANRCIDRGLRIAAAFIPTPFCTEIGMLVSVIFQFISFHWIYRRLFYVEGKQLRMFVE
ncbi:hypothetical protein [Ethanoligenens sp.]|uniref:hypothetical protein n=1 Tax=Ethanoligenens sp. TaxID=2099655 RepID=UPI0039EC7F4B